jgi:hypothetical protein
MNLNDTTLVPIVKLANAMLTGSLRPALWIRSRVVLLPEDDGSHRPLGVGEAWYRLVGRLAVSIVGQSTGHKLLPIQLGCSIKSGCEIGARLGPVILKSD